MSIEGFELCGRIAKINEERRTAFGWAYMSRRTGKDVIDHSGEFIPIGELERAVYPFVKAGAVAGVMHGRTGVGKLVESMLFTKEKWEALGVANPAAMPEGWWVGVEYHDDEAWEGVKKGRYRAFSIHGKGRRHKVSKKMIREVSKMTELRNLISGVELDELSLVDAPDDPEAQILLWKGERAPMETLIGKSRSEIAALHEELTSYYQTRGLSPKAAWEAAASSELGQEIREAYYSAPEEPRTVAKHEETPQRAPEVVTLSKKADEIRERAARMGSPIDPATAFARACDENPELVRSYYNR